MYGIILLIAVAFLSSDIFYENSFFLSIAEAQVVSFTAKTGPETNEITIIFSDSVTGTTAESDWTVGDNTVTGITTITTSDDVSSLMLTVGTSLDTDATPSITYTKPITNPIVDGSDNQLPTTSPPVITADGIAPTFTGVTLQESTGKLLVTFSEIIDVTDTTLKDQVKSDLFHIRSAGKFNNRITLSNDELDTDVNSDKLLFTLSFDHDLTLSFISTPTLIINVGAVQDISGNEFNSGSGFDLSKAGFSRKVSESFSSSSVITGLQFNNVGDELSILSQTEISVYSVEPKFTPSVDSQIATYSLSSRGERHTGFTFSEDDLKLFTIDNGNFNVDEYTVDRSEPSTISLVNFINVEDVESVPRDLVFSNDGMAFFYNW